MCCLCALSSGRRQLTVSFRRMASFLITLARQRFQELLRPGQRRIPPDFRKTLAPKSLLMGNPCSLGRAPAGFA